MFDDDFEFEVPEELSPWFEAKREEQRENVRKLLTKYILVNGKVKAVDFMTWAMWFGNHDQRRVDKTDISNFPNYPGGDCVSTVFIGIDMNFEFESYKVHVPTLFETMVFGGEFDQRMWRYATFGEAKRGHWQFVECLREGRRPEADRGERPFIDYFFEMWDEQKKEEKEENS